MEDDPQAGMYVGEEPINMFGAPAGPRPLASKKSHI
jgi:hypothetical protein